MRVARVSQIEQAKPNETLVAQRSYPTIRDPRSSASVAGVPKFRNTYLRTLTNIPFDCAAVITIRAVCPAFAHPASCVTLLHLTHAEERGRKKNVRVFNEDGTRPRLLLDAERGTY